MHTQVHRNWMAIAHKLPPRLWYHEATSIWTLDYPPLFAWFEKLVAFFGARVDPAMVSIHNIAASLLLVITSFLHASITISITLTLTNFQRLVPVLVCEIGGAVELGLRKRADTLCAEGVCDCW
jgi:ALG6, ALG8 glycosyltransferase family